MPLKDYERHSIMVNPEFSTILASACPANGATDISENQSVLCNPRQSFNFIHQTVG
jgi:hypothetical protein